jgi:hypothetical protein
MRDLTLSMHRKFQEAIPRRRGCLLADTPQTDHLWAFLLQRIAEDVNTFLYCSP